MNQLTGIAAAAINFSGALSGDVTGTQSSTVVALVGGQTAASVATGAQLANAATNLNTASTIVKRDINGNFTAGTITAILANNYKLIAYALTARTITAATETVRYSQIIADPNSNYNAVTWTYTAPVTGYYQVATVVTFTSPGSSGAGGTVRSIQLVRNATPVTGYSAATSVFANAATTCLSLTSLIQLTAAQTLSVQFTGSLTGGGDTITANNTSLNIHFVSV